MSEISDVETLRIEWALCCLGATPTADGFVSLDRIVQTFVVQQVPCQVSIVTVFSVRGTPQRGFTYHLDAVTPTGVRRPFPSGLLRAVVGRHGVALLRYAATGFLLDTPGEHQIAIYLADALTPSWVIPLLVVLDSRAGLPVSRLVQ